MSCFFLLTKSLKKRWFASFDFGGLASMAFPCIILKLLESNPRTLYAIVLGVLIFLLFPLVIHEVPKGLSKLNSFVYVRLSKGKLAAFSV